MTVTWFDAISITVEVALTTAVGSAGVWDAAAWDTGVWGPDVSWTDVSEWCRGFETNRGFSRDLRSWQAGTATITLDNRDGRFSPDNLSGPYVAAGVTGIRPGRPARIRIGYAGTTWDVWTGYVTSWEERWNPAGPGAGDATMVLRCSDEWWRLSAVKGSATVAAGAGETCGPRWTRILNAAGFVGSTDLDVGTVTLQATDLSTDPVQELVLTADSEGGWIYVEADGTIVGRDQYAIIEDTRCTVVQAEFGDGVGQIPWVAVDVAPVDLDGTINIAAYLRVGGTEQRYTDATSRALYGDRYDRGGNAGRLVCETDAQALSLATRTVAASRSPESRVQSVTVAPRGDPTSRVAAMLDLKVRDLVEVSRQPPSAWAHTMTRSCFVAGIRHRLDSSGRWMVTFDLSSATAWRAFSTSIWDTGLWGSGVGDPAAAAWFY